MAVTVLAVHDDVAFLFALALQLEPRGVALLPADSVKSAERLSSELKLRPDLLIINCKLRGTCAFAAESLQRWPALKVAAVVSKGHRCARCRHLLDATIEDSSAPEIASWRTLVLTLIHQKHMATQ